MGIHGSLSAQTACSQELVVKSRVSLDRSPYLSECCFMWSFPTLPLFPSWGLSFHICEMGELQSVITRALRFSPEPGGWKWKYQQVASSLSCALSHVTLTAALRDMHYYRPHLTN